MKNGGESNPDSNQFCKSCGSTLEGEFIRRKTFWGIDSAVIGYLLFFVSILLLVLVLCFGSLLLCSFYFIFSLMTIVYMLYVIECISKNNSIILLIIHSLNFLIAVAMLIHFV